MSYCCKRTDCNFKCCDGNGDCTSSYTDKNHCFNGGFISSSVLMVVLFLPLEERDF